MKKVSRRNVVMTTLAIVGFLGFFIMLGAEGAGVNNDLDAIGVFKQGFAGFALMFGSMLVAYWLEV